MLPLYGDLPIQATCDFIKRLPESSVSEAWCYIGAFLVKYYGTDYDFVPDEEIVESLVQSYNDQHHSGYSHLVVTQMIFEYFSGKMNENNKSKIRKARSQVKR